MSLTGVDLRTTGTAHDGNCREAHISLTITSMDGEVGGAHLRRQRQLAGFSIRALAEAAHLSATRVRQIEDAERVTGPAVRRYLDSVAEAWRVRASDTARVESADAVIDTDETAETSARQKTADGNGSREGHGW